VLTQRGVSTSRAHPLWRNGSEVSVTRSRPGLQCQMARGSMSHKKVHDSGVACTGSCTYARFRQLPQRRERHGKTSSSSSSDSSFALSHRLSPIIFAKLIK